MLIEQKYPVISKRKSDAAEYFEYHLVQMGTWDFFDDFLVFFKKEYAAEIMYSNDMIWIRKCKLLIGQEIIHFEHHADIGNWFYSLSNTAKPLLEKIANDLKARLEQNPLN